MNITILGGEIEFVAITYFYMGSKK